MKPGINYVGVAVGAMIFNEKNKLFITKRGQKSTNERGYWEIPGGKVEFGETLQNAIKREVKEEYGIDIELIEQFPAANHLIPNEKQHWVPTTFLAKIKNGQKPKILEPEKCDEIGWFSLNKLPKPLSIITKIDLNYYQKTKQLKPKKINHEEDSLLPEVFDYLNKFDFPLAYFIQKKFKIGFSRAEKILRQIEAKKAKIK